MPVPTRPTVLLIGCNAAFIVDQRAFRGASSPFITHHAAHPDQRRSAQIGRVTEALRTAQIDAPHIRHLSRETSPHGSVGTRRFSLSTARFWSPFLTK